MLTGIISSKEGHDKFHIDDTKRKTNFWNVDYDVTIGLTQKSCLTIGVKSQHDFPLNIGQHDRRLGSIDLTRRNTM